MLVLEQSTHTQPPKLFLKHAAPISSHEEQGLDRDKNRRQDNRVLPTYHRALVALSIWEVTYLQSSSEYSVMPIQTNLLH